MTAFIEKHFKELVILLLLILCLLLYARRNNGRYMLCQVANGGGVYVLDSKTSELWLRGGFQDGISYNIYEGTNNKPHFELKKTPKSKGKDPNQ